MERGVLVARTVRVIALLFAPVLASLLSGACGGGDAGGRSLTPASDDAGSGADVATGVDGAAPQPIVCPAPDAVASEPPSGACTSPGYGDDFDADDTAALLALAPFYDESTGRFGNAWWTAANAIEAAETSYARTGGMMGGKYMVDTHATVAPDSAYINGFYDDEGWWANAWVHAYDVTGDANYLATAKYVFDDIKGGWDTGTCSGGVWWSKQRNYKNAIANELFLLLAASLHVRTPGDSGPGSYLDWAQREWAWFSASGMENAKHLVNDGLDASCKNNGGTTWTYNQGVLVAGLVELRRAAGDESLVTHAEAIADAAIAALTDKEGILHEPCEPNCGADGPQFKGVFTRELAKLHALDARPAYRDFLARNAHAIWTHDRNATGDLGLVWSGPFDSADVTRQNSAMVTLASAASGWTTAGPLLRGSGDPSFCHVVGAADGDAAWSCDAKACPSSGFLQLGPGATYLPPGAHVAHVRMSVDAAQPGATCVLATVQVRSASDGGTPLARADVDWSRFANTLEPVDFALPYVVTKEGDAVEVRVWWHAQPGAPRLSVRDVVVDAAHAWSAANLAHDAGRIGAGGAWVADPYLDAKHAMIVSGPATTELPAGPVTASFELAVDAPATVAGTIATLSVFDHTSGQPVAKRDLGASDFPGTLFRTLDVPFTATAAGRYDFDLEWAALSGAPRLAARGVYAVAGRRVDVPLPYDLRGIGTSAGDADVDGKGYALKTTALPSPLRVGLRAYTLGPTTAGAKNVVSAAGQSIALPAGAFGALRILGMATNGTQASQPFTLKYTDGSSDEHSLSWSDWAASSPGADEAFAAFMPERWAPAGTGYGEFHLFEHVVPVAAGKTANTLVVPADGDVKIFAVALDTEDGR
jgi:predicted alpha-1,6-mannanase (GH76 family)